jgi:hypothetical protein
MPDYKPLTPEWYHDIIQIYFAGEATPEQIVHLINKRKWWPPEFLARAEHKAKIEEVRNGIQNIRDEDGNRLFHSLRRPNGRGKVEPVYVNEELFDVAMYTEVLNDYYLDIARQRTIADRLRRNCFGRYKLWLPTYEEWANGSGNT